MSDQLGLVDDPTILHQEAALRTLARHQPLAAFPLTNEGSPR